MKNVFKKEEGYSETITAIHTEFRSAGDKLYDEAVTIINSIKLLNEEKVVRLKRLGFTASKEVMEAERIISKRKMSEGLVELIAYYREQYPMQKFITEDQVREICKKYNLVYGKADTYIGFVPESKLKLMESFELKEKDACYLTTSSWMDQPIPATYEEYKRKHKGFYVYADTSFLIAAPQSDFKMTSRQEIREHKIVDKPIPDPVVMAPVRGGYLIVAAWGAEASDPIVVNDISN